MTKDQGIVLPRRTFLTAVGTGVAAVTVGCADGTDNGAPANMDLPGRQTGVISPPPLSTHLIAMDLLGTDPREAFTELHSLFSDTSQVELTISVGASMFDERFGLADRKPAGLTVMPQFPGDVLDTAQCHGDLLIQISADDRHDIDAVSDQLAQSPDLVTRWQITGFRDNPSETPHGVPTSRNQFGFTEGIGNPDPGNTALMDELVWAKTADIPEWATGGTYLVVRLIRFAMELWDTDTTAEQERVFGRHKDSGAPLGLDEAEVDPQYDTDPHGERIALDAHIRRARPRTDETEPHQILRRGYSYDHGVDDSGHQDAGMVFIAYQNDVRLGFETIQHRLRGEALEKYVLTFGGGYYYTLPAASRSPWDELFR